MDIGDFELENIGCPGDLIGKNFFFRTVTYHIVGRVVTAFDTNSGTFLRLEDASWVANSGRFMQALRDGDIDEVEPVGHAFLNLDTVTDFFPWVHDLPTEQR
jgi:hypothetical protein